MDAKCHDVGINKNAGTHDAAHHDHGGVEYSEQLPRFDKVQKSAHGRSSSRLSDTPTHPAGRGLDRDHLTIAVAAGLCSCSALTSAVSDSSSRES